MPSEWMRFSEPGQHTGVTPLTAFPVLSPSRLLQPLICWVGTHPRGALSIRSPACRLRGSLVAFCGYQFPPRVTWDVLFRFPTPVPSWILKEWFLPQSESPPCLYYKYLEDCVLVYCCLGCGFLYNREGMSENCALIAVGQRHVALPVQRHPPIVSAVLSSERGCVSA